MRSYITTSSKLSEIKMLIDRKQYKSKVFIIVEGKTDIKLFRKLFDANNVQIESVDGKNNVKSIIAGLINDYADRVLGIADADFDHILNIQHNPDLCLTDTHDVETMIINELGFDSIISEYAKDEYHDSLKKSLLTKIISIVYDVGLIKLLNETQQLNIKFKDTDISKFASINNFNISFNMIDYVNALIKESGSIKYIDKDMSNYINTQIENLKKSSHPPFMVCCGHDLTNLASKILKQKNLTLNVELEDSDVESLLRISYGMNDFSKSNLFAKIIDWQRTNNKQLLAV